MFLVHCSSSESISPAAAERRAGPSTRLVGMTLLHHLRPCLSAACLAAHPCNCRQHSIRNTGLLLLMCFYSECSPVGQQKSPTRMVGWSSGWWYSSVLRLLCGAGPCYSAAAPSGRGRECCAPWQRLSESTAQVSAMQCPFNTLVADKTLHTDPRRDVMRFFT